MEHYTRTIAVVTGDLLNSTALGENQIAQGMAALEVCATDRAHHIASHFTRQSGDGWQIVVERPERALRAALMLRAALRTCGLEFETYISISVGQIKAAPGPDLNTMNAPVFVNSGQELIQLKDRAQKDGILIAHRNMGVGAAVAILADHISQSWTPPQARAMLLFLDPDFQARSYTQAGKMLGITRQAATKTLKAAGKDALLNSLLLLETSASTNPEESRNA